MENTSLKKKNPASTVRTAYKFTEKDIKSLKALLNSEGENITFVADVVYLSFLVLMLEEHPQPNRFAKLVSRIKDLKKTESLDARGAAPFSHENSSTGTSIANDAI